MSQTEEAEREYPDQDSPATQDNSEETTVPSANKKIVAFSKPTISDSCDQHFNIEDSFYRSRLPRSTHWSVAWSDLMMTMFILFLSMFVYQAAHEDFLVDKTPEVIGGDTTDALDVNTESGLIVPITPIRNTVPLISAGTVKRIETVQIDELDIDEVFKKQITPKGEIAVTPETIVKIEKEQEVIKEMVPSAPPLEQDVIEPAPLALDTEPPPEIKQTDKFTEIYDMSKQVLQDKKMGQFATVDLIRDTTMRIILTGDLLFSTGQADLSRNAKTQLQKLSAVIQNSPYMINVIGHTDNQPMNSPIFASNWELSVVRASRVARFLIETMGMNPQQFIVSGYGANRPRVPNSNVVNRATNRRVEIIISKKLAPAVQATPENIL